MLESTNLMQQHNFDVLIQEEEHRLNRLEKEEMVPRYISVSPPYYWNGQKNEEFEQRAHNFEPPIHYVHQCLDMPICDQ